MQGHVSYRWLSTFQMLDSSFPMGTFAQSFGLETAVQQRRVLSAEQLFHYLLNSLRTSLAPMEAGAASLVADLLDAGELTAEREAALIEIDRVLVVQRMARESREGVTKVGKRYLEMLLRLHDLPALHAYKNLIRHKRCLGHPAVVHALVMHGIGASREEMLTTFLYSSLHAQTSNGVRLIPLGQTDGQLIIQRLFPAIISEVERLLQHPPVTCDDLWSAGIRTEMDGMAHEQLYSRLFMS